MNIYSKRFSFRTSLTGHGYDVRDRDAPYHLHYVGAGDVPTEQQMATMTERQFDAAISKAIYRGE